MVSYAIEAAKASGLFDRILVSTDDAEIKNVSEEWGAEAPFQRPPHLSDDNSPTAPVVAHALRHCLDRGLAVSEVCCLYPCVPFIRVDDLHAALGICGKGGALFSFPVAEYPSPIQRALRMDADGRTLPFQPQYEYTRTQDLEPAYHDAGQFYWGGADAWLESTHIHSNGKGLVIPAWRAVDIDTPEDWERAERMWLVIHGDKN